MVLRCGLILRSQGNNTNNTAAGIFVRGEDRQLVKALVLVSGIILNLRG